MRVYETMMRLHSDGDLAARFLHGCLFEFMVVSRNGVAMSLSHGVVSSLAGSIWLS